MRCERCKTSELTLVTFGVYDCPVCGRVDADGNVLGGKGGDDTGPQTFESERASFVAPPPVGASVPIVIRPEGKHDMPTVFLATMVISGLFDVGSALATRSILGFVLRVAFYGALLTGKPWARSFSIVGAGLSMVLSVALVLVFPSASNLVRTLLTVSLVANGWWLYVLLRPDTVAYFTRAR